ncbi:uncharacterized protein LOC123526870 [Mercenaria mercenaria]|uniref:uncharacterized protein LOC123526870 n=1 Tax=Mercenaria mercenaria TaxID=6596 RepID=UPI00234E8E08|nr:uncharacterized protein LOC123526870 [Mercenaria mercenaria]
MDTTKCDPCKARSRSLAASYWCPFCREAFCKVCCQFHQTMKLTRSHKVQALTELNPRDREQGGSGQSFRLETLTPVTFNEKTQLREIDNILVFMDGLSDTSLTLKKMFFDLKMKNESEKNECMRKVILFKERLKQLADDFERHISGELEYLQHAENVQVDARIEECEQIFNALEMSKDLAQNMKTEYITPQTISKVNAARQRCNEYKFTLQRIHSRLQPVTYNLAIDRNVSDALNTTPGVIGKVEVGHENDDLFDDRDVKLNRRASNVSNLPRVSGSMMRQPAFHTNSEHAQKVNEIYLNRKDDHDEPMITSICVMSNNHFITLDRSNNKLLLVHQDGAIVTSYVFTSQIWDMTLIDSLTVAVTVPDNDKIVLVKVRNKNLCAEKLIKTSNICYGITSIEGFMVVTVKGGYVKIVTKAGEEVASIRHNPRGDVLFTDPQHIATNREQNELYVSDYTLHTVTALFLTGVKIDSQPKFVFRNNELQNPTGLCLDVQGNVYVCGYSSHNVLKLSSDGNLLLALLTGIMNPQTVALTTMEDQLLVSSLSTGGQTKHMQNVIEVFRI